MTFIDMFCGIGTVRMGFEKAGWECVYSIEWDKHKRRMYDVIFGKEPEGRDIRECRAVDLPRADCWTFGAPCQDFSFAGTRSGLEGDRSSLVREVFRLVRETKEEYRPQWLLYENVKGMFSSNKGFDYLEILAEMESLGYDIEWQLLNSKNFGVPQSRQRVFTIGHLRKRGRRKIFPIAQEMDYKQDKTLVADYRFDEGLRIRKESVTPTLCAEMNGSCLSKAIILPELGRIMTPREMLKLQGVKDVSIDKLIAAGISDAQMYRGAGDACTTTVIYEIAKRLKEGD